MKIIKCLKNIPWYEKWSIFIDDRYRWNNITFNWKELDKNDKFWIDYIIRECNKWIFEITEIK